MLLVHSQFPLQCLTAIHYLSMQIHQLHQWHVLLTLPQPWWLAHCLKYVKFYSLTLVSEILWWRVMCHSCFSTSSAPEINAPPSCAVSGCGWWPLGRRLRRAWTGLGTHPTAPEPKGQHKCYSYILSWSVKVVMCLFSVNFDNQNKLIYIPQFI